MAALLPDDLTERAQTIINEWAPRLGFTFPTWRVVLKFDENEDQAAAETVPRYRDIVVRLNPSRITDKTDLEELIVHELCHAFTARIWDHTERLILRYKPPEEVPEWRWFLEEMHEECVTRIAYSMIHLARNPA